MLGLVLGLIAGIPGAAPRATAAALPPFERAQWVWGNPEAPETHLRKVLKLPARPAQASVLITADNGYELFVNGAFVGGESGVESGVWQSVERYDIASKLAPGRNVIGIRGIDLGGVRGVIAAFRIEVTNQPPMEFVTDDSWQVTDEGRPVDYSHPEYVEGPQWTTATALGPMGMAPWGTLNPTNAGGPQRTAKGREFTRSSEPPPGFRWPGPVAFVGEDCSVYVPLRGDAWGVCFRVGDWSRAFTEFDLPCPTKIGRKLLVLTPGPGAQPRVLLDAGAGVLGSPSATFDGRDLLVALARDHDSFFHIWRVPMDGTAPRRLTDGPCHDIDPVELPDGRIVFTSTRIGTFEEYHQPPSRALFRMNADGTDIHPITSTLIFDNEPKVTADGRIAFVRTDNFFDRGKVETQIHSIRPDGTDGLAEFAANVGADYGVRLRAFGFGSPAPLPDGHLAYISSHGNFIGMKGSAQREQIRLPGDLGDLAALPDGRVLCTVLRPDGKRQTSDVLAVFDAADGSLVKLHESASGGLHSPVFAGPRTRPPVIPDYVDRTRADRPDATGFLFCQDARFTTKGRAGWDRIRAIRVLGAVPLTVRSSHSHIVHVGHETVELGTVPLAPDGSFSIEVPADTPLALQAVDGEGRSELNEMSWLYVRPGERRSCIGCHQPREAAPSFHHTPADALRSPPVRLTGQGDPHRFRGNNPGVTGMMDLQFDRFRECASLNRNALRREPNAGRAQELASLKSALSGTNEALRLSSAQRLAMLRDSGAEAPLNSALAQPSRELRVAAALALATCGTREAVKPLLAALSDRDTAVADAAAVALENLTTHPAQRTEAAAWAAWFATNSWESIEAGLVRQLAGRPADVRAAVVALGHVGGESAMAALREFVRTTAARNPYPVFKNDNRTDLFTFPADSPLNPRTLQEAVRALGRL